MGHYLTMLRTAFLIYVRVLLCLQGVYLAFLGWVFSLDQGPDTRVWALDTIALWSVRVPHRRSGWRRRGAGTAMAASQHPRDPTRAQLDCRAAQPRVTVEDATSLEAQEITGPGVVSTYTVNYHAWLPGLAVRFTARRWSWRPGRCSMRSSGVR